MKMMWQGVLWHLQDDQEAKCQLCSTPLRALKDARHVLEWCDNATYMEIRTRLYEKSQEKTRNQEENKPGVMAPPLRGWVGGW